jgi:hypothetical protein
LSIRCYFIDIDIEIDIDIAVDVSFRDKPAMSSSFCDDDSQYSLFFGPNPPNPEDETLIHLDWPPGVPHPIVVHPPPPS